MSTRMQRADATIQSALSKIILEDLNDPRLSNLVTVTNVKTTPDFSYSKIKISVLSDSEEERQNTLKLIVKSGSFIRTSLCNSIRLPSAPKLVFELDEGASHSEKINKILESLVIPPVEDDNE